MAEDWPALSHGLAGVVKRVSQARRIGVLHLEEHLPERVSDKARSMRAMALERFSIDDATEIAQAVALLGRAAARYSEGPLDARWCVSVSGRAGREAARARAKRAR